MNRAKEQSGKLYTKKWSILFNFHSPLSIAYAVGERTPRKMVVKKKTEVSVDNIKSDWPENKD